MHLFILMYIFFIYWCIVHTYTYVWILLLTLNISIMKCCLVFRCCCNYIFLLRRLMSCWWNMGIGHVIFHFFFNIFSIFFFWLLKIRATFLSDWGCLKNFKLEVLRWAAAMAEWLAVRPTMRKSSVHVLIRPTVKIIENWYFFLQSLYGWEYRTFRI